MSPVRMNFYFCLAVFFVPVFLAQRSVENNDDLISNYSRSSEIENSDSNYNAGRANNEGNQYGYGQDGYGYGPNGYGYGQDGYGYGQAYDVSGRRGYDQDGYGYGQAGDVSGQHGHDQNGYGYGQDGYGYDQDGYAYSQAGTDNVKSIRRRTLPRDTACLLPNELKDSEVNCRIYSAKVVCNHTCMFGYTFSDGIQRQMECNYKEDKWTPVPEFESCKPFVDCGVTMGPGGGYTCQKDFMDKGPICEIFCEPYEDKDAVKAQTYSCDIEGKWTPELPFCATPGSGLNLVPAPSVWQISDPQANHP